MKWQPIETAPKDGTRFLAAWQWLIGTDWCYAVMHYRNNRLMVSWDHDEGPKPTHWKPISEPKTKKKEQ
jgi:hypothetical protein